VSGKKHKKPFEKEVSPGGHFGQAKQRRGLWKIAVFLIAIAISSTAVAIFLNFSQPAKAALVDHLSLTFPNQSLIDNTTEILEQAGYTVDYYPGEEVTVEFYKNLPTHNYDIIILRVHSALVLEGNEIVEAPVSFFTSENYSQTRYVWEQWNRQLAIAFYPAPEPLYYFGIGPKFVTTSMNGKFQNTIIVTMGCEGLTNTKMAEAFIEKGAKTYIGWNGSVSASHTDQATIYLLTHLLTEKETIEQAVENTMREVGPDPAYNSILLYYPP